MIGILYWEEHIAVMAKFHTKTTFDINTRVHTKVMLPSEVDYTKCKVHYDTLFILFTSFKTRKTSCSAPVRISDRNGNISLNGTLICHMARGQKCQENGI